MHTFLFLHILSQKMNERFAYLETQKYIPNASVLVFYVCRNKLHVINLVTSNNGNGFSPSSEARNPIKVSGFMLLPGAQGRIHSVNLKFRMEFLFCGHITPRPASSNLCFCITLSPVCELPLPPFIRICVLAFSKVSSQPRDQICISCISGRFFAWEAQ